MRKPDELHVWIFLCVLLVAGFVGRVVYNQALFGGADFRLQLTREGDVDRPGPETLCAEGVSFGEQDCLSDEPSELQNLAWIHVVLHEAVGEYNLVYHAGGDAASSRADWIRLRLTRRLDDDALVQIEVYIDQESFALEIRDSRWEKGDHISRTGTRSDHSMLTDFDNLLFGAINEIGTAELGMVGLTRDSGFHQATLWVKMEEPDTPSLPGTTF